MTQLLQTCRPPSIASGYEAGPLLAAVIQAKDATARVLDGPNRRATIDAMVEKAHAIGAEAIYGASDVGHCFAGAMAYASPRLRLWQPGEHAALLLVDGCVASVSGMGVAAERVSAVGATRIDALVVALWLEQRELESVPRIDRIVVLDETERQAA
jgi:hypothetical protein